MNGHAEPMPLMCIRFCEWTVVESRDRQCVSLSDIRLSFHHNATRALNHGSMVLCVFSSLALRVQSFQ